MERDLKEIIDRISTQNDEFAFSSLYRTFFPGLLSFATSIVKSRALAEEAVEDVFVKVWEHRKMLPAIRNMAQYLYVATKHTSFNYLRSKKNIVFEEIGDAFAFSISDPGLNSLHKENLQIILSAINALPPRCRLVFRLVRDEAMRHSEVAQLLEISEKTVSAQISYALTRIAETLQQTLPEFAAYYARKKTM